MNTLAGYDEEGAYVPPGLDDEDDDEEEEEEIDESIHFDEASEIRYTVYRLSFLFLAHIIFEILLTDVFFNLDSMDNRYFNSPQIFPIAEV